ncbi:MAG: DNA-binding protein [Candidatus Methanolliviera hydrocarbonicum]|uniref:DNA-binding protein EF807_04615 n=1 Tax=Candidatus Methanolliviera hydrocarbonicum TaxID=2491085 RepID=A0A520KWL5_9EURY|nr:MAG: DNA-binding protein [Candidatus Methanolliviera hydrocarbonicum]
MADEIEEIKRRRLQQMMASQQDQLLRQDQEEAFKREHEVKKKEVLRKIMMPEARERLNNIKVAKPEFAMAIEEQLITLASSGRLKSMITDEQLKTLLGQIQPKKRDIKVRRI